MAHCAEVPSAEPLAGVHRRRSSRHALRSLAYVRFENGNGGIVRDLTESGAAIQAVAPLQPGEEVSLRFDLFSPRVRVEASGRVAWSDAKGQAGIQFHALSVRLRRALKDWLLFQMLSYAAISGHDTIFASTNPQFIISAAPERPAIILETRAPAAKSEKPETQARLRWGWFVLSPGTLARCVDTLALICGVLIFAVSSLAVMGGLPAWPLAVALLITTSVIFVAIYQIVFSDFVCGATPGRRLANLVARDVHSGEAAQRFR